MSTVNPTQVGRNSLARVGLQNPSVTRRTVSLACHPGCRLTGILAHPPYFAVAQTVCIALPMKTARLQIRHSAIPSTLPDSAI